ncbi:MAG: mycothione reductase [Corynebacterium sp.]|nr:mycothione reductase [Corynebacterium sp.]
MKHYDLVIIGTGSGNSLPGPDLLEKYPRIAMVEESTFGGTCLNVGCIPTKMFVHAAEVAHTARDSHRFGVHAHVDYVDWPEIRNRVFGRIDPIAQGGKDYRLNDPDIDVYLGHGTFTSPTTMKVDEQEFSFDNAVIAAGARPHIPDEVAHLRYYTNQDIMRLDQLPRSMVILGGGFVACEFAHVFSSLGVEVHQINRSPRLLRRLDDAVSERFTESVSWHTHLGRTIDRTFEDSNGVALQLDDGSTVVGEVLLVATGRIPNGDTLGCEAAGIVLDGTRVVVDEFGRTHAPGIWALGDISSPFQLKHVANAEMRAVRHNLLNPEDLQPMPHEHVPAAVFTHPQIAWVGLTEQEARAQGYEVAVATQNYGDIAYGWAMEDTTGFAKLIADKNSGVLLGAHIIGPQASTVIQPLITAMSHGISMRDFARSQYWIHPAMPELIENAVLQLGLS